MNFSIFPTWSLVTSGVILFIGLLFFVVLVTKARRKHKAIKHYEEIRDKLTIREAEEETGITEEEYKGYSGFNLGNIISSFIAIVVGFSLFPIITEQIALASQSQNISESTIQILNMAPIFFVIAIILAVGFPFASYFMQKKEEQR